MAVTTFASDTLTTTIGTEHTLTSVNQAGVFVLYVDLAALAAGDVVELRAYKIVRTGGTARVVQFQTFTGAQPSSGLITVSIPLANDLTDTDALTFTLTQTFGTARSFPWAVLKVA
jgi:hypothetical protein